MLLNQSSNINLNYAAKIIKIEAFVPHPNPKCERLKCVHIDGYSIAVGKDTEVGTYVYFPIECQISTTYLQANNLFRHSELNADSDASPGFFEDNGRVKIIKLQGMPSEGFIMPVQSLHTWIATLGYDTSTLLDIKEGVEFDMIDRYLLCQKYVARLSKTPGAPGTGKDKSKQPKGLSKIVDNQFRFHYDTTLIKKCPWVIKPNDIISITSKVHGTSGISAKVLCTRPLGWKDKIANWLSPIPTTTYDELWSSRKVVKNQYYNSDVNGGYYNCDVWGIAHNELREYITKGMTLYYEIIGYLPSGGAIQAMNGKTYDYGYEAPTSEEYICGKHYGIRVYRITYTNPDGIVYEFSARQVQQWCASKTITPVTEFYYGYAKDLYPDLDISEHWNENFIQRLSADKNFFMEELSPECKNQVPHEGIVIRIEDGLSRAYKLKCFRFLGEESKSLDKGESDIESDQE